MVKPPGINDHQAIGKIVGSLSAARVQSQMTVMPAGSVWELAVMNFVGGVIRMQLRVD